MDDWWTGSPSAGIRRAIDMGGPLPPMELANNPALADYRRRRINAGLSSEANAQLEPLGGGAPPTDQALEALFRRWLQEQAGQGRM